MGIIRLLLAFAVFTHHETVLTRELLPGTVSVRLFFIISGFYMALILDERYGAKPKALFYSNRLLRLFPAYLVVMLASLALLALADAHPFLSLENLEEVRWNAPPASLVLAGLSNLLLVGQNLFFITDLTPELGLTLAPCHDCPVLGFWLLLVPQAWSIAVELGFYLLAPFLVHRRTSTLLLVGAASLALHLGIALNLPEGANMAHHLLSTQLYLFILGIVAYRGLALAARLPRRASPGALALLIGTLLGYNHLADPWRFPLAATIMVFCLPLIFQGMRDCSWDRLLGELSYPFYISQFVVIGACEHWLPEAPPLLPLAGTVLAALALYSLVDRPMSRLRAARLTPALVLPPVTPEPEPLVPAPVPAVAALAATVPTMGDPLAP